MTKTDRAVVIPRWWAQRQHRLSSNGRFSESELWPFGIAGADSSAEVPSPMAIPGNARIHFCFI
jgi:hypothetical protein